MTENNTSQLISRYDYIYVDASTWMSPEAEQFLQLAAPTIRACGHKLILSSRVEAELENCATQKPSARHALSLIERHSDLIQKEESGSEGTADGEFVRQFFFNHRKRNQMLITHDQQLTADIRNCCITGNGEEGYSTAVMTLWNNGDLIELDEMVRRKERLARARLLEMVGNSPLYIDGSALLHENAGLFLRNVATPLLTEQKKLLIVRNTLTSEIQDFLTSIPELGNELISIIPSDPTLPEQEALFGELYLNPNNMGLERVILVTDNAENANDLRIRRPKSDRFPFVDFMTINKYGYLSYLRLTDAATQPAPTQRPRQTARPSGNTPTFHNNAPERPIERKASAFIPQLIGAIKSENIEAMCDYITKGANLRNGIITALCQGKDKCLRVLIETAKAPIDPGCFEWWVTCYNDFANPTYLADNPEHFELMQMLVSKSAPMQNHYRSMITLAERVSSEEAARRQLWAIIRLAIEKDAPASVYAHSTGETLPEIARRQNQQEMLNFLQGR